jgi:hypothetical protein
MTDFNLDPPKPSSLEMLNWPRSTSSHFFANKIQLTSSELTFLLKKTPTKLEQEITLNSNKIKIVLINLILMSKLITTTKVS